MRKRTATEEITELEHVVNWFAERVFELDSVEAVYWMPFDESGDDPSNIWVIMSRKDFEQEGRIARIQSDAMRRFPDVDFLARAMARPRYLNPVEDSIPRVAKRITRDDIVRFAVH